MTEKRFKKGFTLMELLVTIGIMAVVVTLTVPAFVGLGRGSKMNSALSNLKNTCSLARQWAISHRDDVYIIFPIGGTSAEDEPVKKLNSYGVYSASQGKFIKEWTYLPEGVILDDEKTKWGSFRASPTRNVPGLSNPQLKAIAYNQEGSLKSGASTKSIYFIEGTIDRETNEPIKTFGQDDRFDAVKVNGLTGLPYIERDIKITGS